MCNLSDLIEEKAMERGMEKGMERGMELARLESIKSLAANMNISVDQAMIILNIPSAEKEHYREKLNR